MTDYFEVLDTDGPGRVGELRLSASIETPGTIDGQILDGGSLWSGQTEQPTSRSDAVTILPHRSFPPGTPEPVIESFDQPTEQFDGPSGLVVHPATADDLGHDVYVLTTGQDLMGHARHFCDVLSEVRAAIPHDAALYLPGVATASNLPILVYAGVDLVDTDRAAVAGSQGLYFTTSGVVELADLETLPCPCRHCSTSRDTFTREDCQQHNIALLEAELATLRRHIQQGELRDYVSAQVRHEPWLTAALRAFDGDHEFIEPRTPLYRRGSIRATTEDDLLRPEIVRYRERIRERYHNRFRTPLVLLPCSAGKPYSDSKSHRQFRKAIDYRAHRVTISSPIGVVPQELECTYPAQHYDVPVTGVWSATERSIIGDELRTYLEERSYPRVIAHVTDAYRELVETAATEVGVEITFTADEHPTTETSLTTLEETLAGELKYSRRDRRRHTVRALADYQFGQGAGDELFSECSVEAPYPKHRVLGSDETHLATMVPEYGLLALTIAGARNWEASAVPSRLVEIDDFVPHGDVLAPGIVSADPSIRPGDEVIVTGPAAYGVGRARAHGQALEEATRGVAVDLRHVEER